MSDTSSAPEGAFIPEERKANPERLAVAVEPAAVAPASVEQKRPPSASGRLVVTVLVAGFVAAVVAVIASVVINIGVQLWAGGAGRGDRLMQEGKVIVGRDGDREVFYAVPFAGPPHLELEGDGDINWNVVKLKEQKADRFVVSYTWGIGGAREFRWRAEGMRAVK